MNLVLRIILLIGALWMLAYVARSVRASKMKAETSFYWIAFSVLLVLIGVFPQAIIWLAKEIGIESPVNFVFLSVIFLLILRIFSLDRKLDKLQSQFTRLIQQYAIDHREEGRKE